MRPLHRVFVTGATGFVGRTVIQALRAEGYVVRCLVRRGSERDLRGVEAIERVEGDVLSPQTLEEGMAGCDAVVHLVGIIREHVPTNTTFYRVPVEQVAQGVARALSRPSAVKQTYEVGGPDRVTLGELVDLIGKVLGRRRILKFNVPRVVVRVATRALHRLPYFPLTPDQLLMLEEDNVCDPAPFFSTFGLAPLPLATGLRQLLG